MTLSQTTFKSFNNENKMFLKQANRLFHAGKSLFNNKSALAELRKKTGYTFSNCKKALELHNNDLIKAEKWLIEQAQALGWSKAVKLEGRTTKQGLVGIVIKNNIGAMVEVNCETDFVSRNEKFLKFVENVSLSCANYAESINGENLAKISINGDELKKIASDNGKTLGDNLALIIGNVGENAILRRAVCFKSFGPIQLFGYTHPSETNQNSIFSYGKYGSIVGFKSSNPEITSDIHKKICQHIVGMNPSKIGVKDVDEPLENKDDEICLIHQEFLSDPTVVVGEILEENNIEIVDFQRFECGENLENEINQKNNLNLAQSAVN